MSAKQKYILKLLSSNGFSLEDMVKHAIEKSQSATAVNPVTGERELSDTVQLSRFKELMNLADLRKPSQFVNVALNLTKIMYGDK